MENLIVDGIVLEVGKSYFVKYKHTEPEWEKITISRITENGHPWGIWKNHSGIITDGNYFVQELTNDSILEQYARKWLSNNLKDNVDTTIVDLFVKMYNDFKI